MMTISGPTAGRRKLRAALRAARESAGLTQETVAEAMDWSLSKIIRIETGRVSISTNDLKALLQLYGITDARRTTDLVNLARVARQKPWWQEYREAVPHHYAQYIGLEAEASSMRAFQPILVAGLLQTEAYARAVLADRVPSVLSRDEAEARIGVRLRRKREILYRSDSPAIQIILEEAVLRRMIGGPVVMREQLDHILTVVEETSLVVQVLPFTAGTHTPSGSFVILQFSDPIDDDVVYLESALIENFLDRPTDTEPYKAEFERLLGRCLSAADSVKMIEKIAGEL